MIFKYHWAFRMLFSVLAMITLCIIAVQFNEFSIFFSAIFFFTLGTALTIKNKDYRIFQIAFFWLLFFASIQALFFHAEYNQLFDRGGDDLSFYEKWILTGYNDFNFALNERYAYKTFIVPASAYLKFINVIGINSVFSFHINILNVFVGAFIPVFVFKTGKILFKSTTAQLAAAFVIVYPFFNYQITKVMRDVYAYLFFTIGVYILFTNWKLLFKLLVILLLLLLTMNARTESVIYILLLFGLYYFIKTKSLLLKGSLMAIVFVAAYIIYQYLNATFSIDLATITKYSEMYNELRTDNEGAGSIATLLKNGGIIGKLISIPYNWISPLPPPIIIQFNLMTLLISIGCFAWYFMLPRGVVKFYEMTQQKDNLLKYSELRALYLTFIVGSVFISYTSGDPRHILVFFPIATLFCVGYFENRTFKFDLTLNYISIIIAFISIIGYLIIKNF